MPQIFNRWGAVKSGEHAFYTRGKVPMHCGSASVITKCFLKPLHACKKEIEGTQNLITSCPALQKVHDDKKALAIPAFFLAENA